MLPGWSQWVVQSTQRSSGRQGVFIIGLITAFIWSRWNWRAELTLMQAHWLIRKHLWHPTDHFQTSPASAHQCLLCLHLHTLWIFCYHPIGMITKFSSGTPFAFSSIFSHMIGTPSPCPPTFCSYPASSRTLLVDATASRRCRERERGRIRKTSEWSGPTARAKLAVQCQAALMRTYGSRVSV